MKSNQLTWKSILIKVQEGCVHQVSVKRILKLAGVFVCKDCPLCVLFGWYLLIYANPLRKLSL